MKKLYVMLLFGVGLTLFFFCGGNKKMITSKAPLEYVKNETKKLAPVELKIDLTQLPESELKTLQILKQAASYIDSLFLIQVYSKNMAIANELANSNNPEDKYYYDLFKIMFGPWNRIDSDKPFINNIPKPEGANFYPEDMTKEEFLNFVKQNPDKKELFENTFTVIRRENGKLKALYYHEEWPNYVHKIHDLLIQAANTTKDSTLKDYLLKRAKAFLTDDYFESDMAWMDLNGDLEIVIGPYEVYEDKLFSYKAAYEAFLCVVDKEESKKLEKITSYLKDMEKNLPIPDKYKNFERGFSSPIKVVNEVFSAGDTKAGVQTTAFNLPNDERVRKAKGSKKVMLKNIAEAKFEKCWIPIVNKILAPEALKNISFEAYFTHTLLHEISHGLGPGFIKKDNKETTVSKELKETYPTIEECKADVLGIYNVHFLTEKGFYDKEFEKEAYYSYLGGMLRSIRFGIGEAHGGGVAIQFNFLRENGAFIIDKNGKLNLVLDKMYPSIKKLANILLTIQATGDYEKAKKLIEKYSKITPELQKFIDQLKDVPIDIKPIFPKI